MYMHFSFYHGGNPYIATTVNKAFNLFCKYNVAQTGAGTYDCLSERTPVRSYSEKKEIAREIAILFQNSFPEGITYSWSELIDYQTFFVEIGKKYGLTREFRENGFFY